MKTLIIISLLLSGMTTSNPKIVRNDLSVKLAPNQFSVRFTYFNHADRLIDGIWTHEIKDGVYCIKNTVPFSDESKELYSTAIGSDIASRIQEVGIEDLEDFYHNLCVMITSGNKYFINFNYNGFEHSVSMNNYYLTEIDSLISIMNELTPDEYKIWYHSPENKQDCN